MFVVLSNEGPGFHLTANYVNRLKDGGRLDNSSYANELL